MEELFEQAIKNMFFDWYPSIDYTIDPFTKTIFVNTDNEKLKEEIAVRILDLVEIFDIKTED